MRLGSLGAAGMSYYACQPPGIIAFKPTQKAIRPGGLEAWRQN